MVGPALAIAEPGDASTGRRSSRCRAVCTITNRTYRDSEATTAHRRGVA
jgi:hypothetical protein